MTITVGTDTYLSVANADAYFTQAIHGQSWGSTATTTKEQCLVTATRILERQVWVGTKTASPQTLSWPRTGVTDKNSQTVDPATVPQQVKDAECELALMLLSNPQMQNDTDTGSKVKSVKAGPTGVDFFKTPTRKVSRFPTIVNDLIGQFLSSAAGSFSGIVISGSENESGFPNSGSFGINRGF